VRRGLQQAQDQDAREGSAAPEFLEALPQADALGSLIKMHDDALRKYRNNVFHLRETTDAFEQFLSGTAGRLQWAKDLQHAFAEFFSTYRGLCQVHYAINDRLEEKL
jgi:hypothetical protein